MFVNRLTALCMMAAALTLTACNDNNTPQAPTLGTTTPIPVTPVTPPVTPAVVTAGSFATGQVKTLTCSNNNTVDVNAVTFTDSESALDVESLTPGCMGGPAS